MYLLIRDVAQVLLGYLVGWLRYGYLLVWRRDVPLNKNEILVNTLKPGTYTCPEWLLGGLVYYVGWVWRLDRKGRPKGRPIRCWSRIRTSKVFSILDDPHAPQTFPEFMAQPLERLVVK